MSVIGCPHCGTINRAGSNFCNRCGADLRGDEASEAAASPPAASSTGEGQDTRTWTRPDETARLDDAAGETGERTEDANQMRHTASSRPSPEETEEESWVSSSSPPSPTSARRLVSGVQGLLDPLQVASEIGDPEETALLPSIAAPLALDAERLRRIRAFLTEDPVLLDMPLATERRPPVRLYLPWLILAFSLALGLPILLDLSWPVGSAQRWPGVDEAYAAIDGLPAGATVLVVWAYDPATAAEMDLVALPLASHLLERRVLPVVISQLPGGLAVADRLFNRALSGLVADSTLDFTLDRNPFLLAGFLPSGAALLALVAQEPTVALVEHAPSPVATREGVSALSGAAATRPALTVVVAAQAEDVQDWLEQGQPLQLAPVVAFTSAAADPLLRPYLASGQLQGLVTGFDGANTYQQRRTVNLAGGEEALMVRQLVLQNWGHLVLLLLLLLGNLTAVGRRETHG